MPQIITFEHKTNFKRGYIDLYGSTGKTYRSTALLIPDYGWVPCSRKLCGNFTTDSSKLQLVVSLPDDEYHPVTSNIWITRTPEPTPYEVATL